MISNPAATSPTKAEREIIKVERVVGHIDGQNKDDPWYIKAWRHMKFSSLFIFHYESVFRLFCLIMVTSNEDIVDQESAENIPEKYGIDKDRPSQDFSMLRISSGKIIPKDNDKIKVSLVFEYFIIFIIFLS